MVGAGPRGQRWPDSLPRDSHKARSRVKTQLGANSVCCSCVTPGKVLNLSEPPVPFCVKWGVMVTMTAQNAAWMATARPRLGSLPSPDQ